MDITDRDKMVDAPKRPSRHSVKASLDPEGRTPRRYEQYRDHKGTPWHFYVENGEIREEVLTKPFENELWEPYPPPVKMDPRNSSLPNELSEFLRKYVYLPSESDYEVLTAWIIATYKRDAFYSVPYLHLVGPIESGKTRVLEVIRLTAYKPVLASHLTSSVVARLIEQHHCTILITQAEDIFDRRTPDGKNMYRIFNAGYRKGTPYIVSKRDDDKNYIKRDVFGFKAMDSVKIFDEALTSRSIVIHMKEGEPKAKWPPTKDDLYKLRRIRGQLLYYSMIEDPPEVERPEWARGRTWELYEPLLRVEEHFKRSERWKLYPKMRETRELTKRLLADSVEADVLYVIYEKVTGGKEGAKIYVKDIAQEVEMKAQQVGYILRNLNIMTKHTRIGKVIELTNPQNRERIGYLLQKFGVGDPKEWEKVTSSYGRRRRPRRTRSDSAS